MPLVHLVLALAVAIVATIFVSVGIIYLILGGDE